VILNIDVAGKEFRVTEGPHPKVDNQGMQRSDKQSGQPIWSTQIVVTDESGGEIIKVSTAGKAPDLEVGEEVEVIDLIAIPWATNGRSGVAYRATAIRPLDD
jgi:hypothetical protein